MNPRTARLRRLAPNAEGIRLSAADRAFFADLGRVQLISDDLATKHHYAHLKGGCSRSLERLEAAGLLTSKPLYVPGQPPVRIYQFATAEIARAWGGRLPVTGAKRTDYHELITAKLYFELGRPHDFRLAASMSAAEIRACGSCSPDAIYTDAGTGELVLVEADSGHYTQSQIHHKVTRWRALGLGRQVWGQPRRAAANVPALEGIAVYRV